METEKEFDLEREVNIAIRKYRDKENFPQVEDYGIDQEDVDDYFYSLTDHPDGDLEEEKKKYTVYGFLIIFPFVVCSFFRNTITNILIAVASGAILSFLYYLYRQHKENLEAKRLANPKIQEYINDVLAFRVQ